MKKKRGRGKGMSDLYLSKYVEHFLLAIYMGRHTSSVNENLSGRMCP